jgi:glutathione peroxidase
MSVHSFQHQDISGNPVSLEKYDGQVLLLVNTASYCGYTKQFDGLQKLYETYAEQGLAVLGFPCNDFGAQDPDSHEEIQTFCSTNYGVRFPMFSKVNAKGEKTALYQYLTEEGPEAFQGEVAWNFTKFLVSGDGAVVGRFEPGVGPMDSELTEAIELEIAKLQ